MNVIDSLFIVSVVEMLIIWGWFIILGFRANKTWGFSMIFFVPITPFIYASRFARRARRAIYYYVITLVIFLAFTVYIHLYTIDFYQNIWKKITTPSPKTITPPPEDFSEPIPVTLRPPPPTVIQPSVEHKPPPKIKFKLPAPTKKRRYKTVSLNDIQAYIDKKVIAFTATTSHKGQLLSVSTSTLSIKKYASGGSVTLPIKKSKIVKIKVYH